MYFKQDDRAEFLGPGAEDQMGRESLETDRRSARTRENRDPTDRGYDGGGGWGMEEGRSNPVQYCGRPGSWGHRQLHGVSVQAQGTGDAQSKSNRKTTWHLELCKQEAELKPRYLILLYPSLKVHTISINSH